MHQHPQHRGRRLGRHARILGDAPEDPKPFPKWIQFGPVPKPDDRLQNFLSFRAGYERHVEDLEALVLLQ